jgi:DNA polymerase III subunit epsilon
MMEGGLSAENIKGMMSSKSPEESRIPNLEEVSGACAIALDFETANSDRGSPCSIGIAWIKNNKIIKTAHRLIKPKIMKFDAMNISIHGIRPEHVKNKPEFPEIWGELLPHTDEGLVFAHNAAFDMSVLRSVLDLYSIPWPTFSYLCTVKIAQQAWPELPDHRLPTVADYLEIPLSHHDAASDATACAVIAVRAMNAVGASDLHNLHRHLQITKGSIVPGGYQACSAASKSRPTKPPPKPAPVVGKPSQAKSFVFTGAMETMLREEASALVLAAGGVCHQSVRKDTDYLVVGNGGPARTAKIEKALAQREKSGRPALIGEAEFFKIIKK